MKGMGVKMKKKGFLKDLTFHYWIMVIPAIAWMFFFNIVPMFGISMAFEDYNPGKGILGSDFVGLDNFVYMFQLNDTKQILLNTIIIAVGKIIGNLIIPIIFALILNEVKSMIFKRSIQTIVYLPHFLSWVVLGGIILDIFSYTGPINQIIEGFGHHYIAFFQRDDLFRGLTIGSDVWKEFGFNAVVYLAAITGISPELYEAAAIDGASKWQRVLKVTLPGIKGVIVLMTVLSLGNILNAGFDQIYNLYNPAVYSSGDIIDTWVYRVGLTNLQFSLAAAVGLLKSVVGFITITTSYLVAYKFADYRIF